MQLAFPLPVPLGRLLGGLGTLRDTLPSRPTYDELVAAIEQGLIGPAFDLRSPGADRALWRIWQPSLELLIKSHGRDGGDPDPDDVLDQLVPRLDDVRSSSLERWWSVTPQHVHGLIAAGCLPVRRPAAAVAGPGSFHLLRREGVREFLAARRLGCIVKCAAH